MTRHHLSLNVRGAIDWPKSKLKKLLIDEETGKHCSAEEARKWLMDVLSEGKEMLPVGECDNFDYKKGCLGHPVQEVQP